MFSYCKKNVDNFLVKEMSYCLLGLDINYDSSDDLETMIHNK